MPPLAYLITWTTYGSWLQGNNRGWVKVGASEIQQGQNALHASNIARLKQPAIVLSAEQRKIVDTAIIAHCDFRKWTIHALNVRTNHVHLVVTASVTPELVMNQLKAWCSRRLNEAHATSTESRLKWWTQHGSTKWINDRDYLGNAIRYVQDGQ